MTNLPDAPAARILVTGATGYIGGRLVPRLLERGYGVRCFARAAGRLRGRFDERVEIVEGDVGNYDDAVRALEGCRAAYYLVHSLSSTSAFAAADRDAAAAFGRAARACGVKRIVYLGGLGEDGEGLSDHLRSRHEVGDVLRASGVPVTEFRAAQIIGSGSVSFEMIRYLTERLPVMIAPRWVMTRCQPIGIRDVIAYLLEALTQTGEAGANVYEIGGADVMTYRDMMLRFAAVRGLKRTIVIVPFFTPRLSSYWVHLITPISAKLAQPLIRGLHNEVIVKDDAARRDFPDIVPMGFEAALRIALDRYRTTSPETAWFDAFDIRMLPDEFTGVKEGMLVDRRVRVVRATPERLAAVFASLGGRRGWLVADRLWQARGILDRWAGGVGLRRGRRSQTDLRLGDAVDFWRVEAYAPPSLLRLRAEMRLPGRAWLQFETELAAEGWTTFRQTAFFEPRGLFGQLYWYGVALFHEWIFARMATRIARLAELPVQAA
ncbi:MAG: DUF2867 domain-containing protein [Candidatus Eremiobacteraeota bacterium]|nr:DUF2867 domain-containing protein [Candidatus Eremiobacteraeota bacterium]MBC5809717.1 DUF2867 domain-containing protein [Candidatus Eremiobacteraeota bacterium]